MASLNTLRTKGGIFLTIVIMIALLAFIIGDFSRGQGNNNPTVAEINDSKVKYMEFENELRYQEMVFKFLSQWQNTNVDPYEQAYDKTWQEFIYSLVNKPGFEKLGLTVSEEEMKDMVSGNYLSPVLTGMFVNPQTRMFDPQLLAYFVSQQDEGAVMLWNWLKKQIRDDREITKYVNLVAKGNYVNSLEVESGLSGNSAVVDARVVFQPYSSIADSLVKVSSKEMEDYYAIHKNRFKRTASRNIEYVMFRVEPSAEDMAAGKAAVDELAAEFAQDSDPASFVANKSPDDKTPPGYVKESDMPQEMLAVLTASPDAVYGPVLNGDMYTMSRLVDTKIIPDSVNLSVIVLTPPEAQLADSLVGVLQRGGDFGELYRTYSKDQSFVLTGGALGMTDPVIMAEQNFPEFEDFLFGAKKGEVRRIDAGEILFVVKMTDVSSTSARNYKVANVRYRVRASEVTQTNILNQATAFYNMAKGSYDDFKKAAAELALSRGTAFIGPMDRAVRNIDNSLKIVRWAFNNTEGAVSEPENTGADNIIVSVITDMTEDGIAPLEKVSDEIHSILIQRKKAAMLAEKMQGGSLDDIARILSLEPIEVAGAVMTDFSLPGIGMEPKLTGAICGTSQIGKLSKPVSGNAGVYVFEVTGMNKADGMDALDMRARLDAANMDNANFVMRAIYDKSNIKDNRVKYF